MLLWYLEIRELVIFRLNGFWLVLGKLHSPNPFRSTQVDLHTQRLYKGTCWSEGSVRRGQDGGVFRFGQKKKVNLIKGLLSHSVLKSHTLVKKAFCNNLSSLSKKFKKLQLFSVTNCIKTNICEQKKSTTKKLQQKYVNTRQEYTSLSMKKIPKVSSKVLQQHYNLLNNYGGRNKVPSKQTNCL